MEEARGQCADFHNGSPSFDVQALCTDSAWPVQKATETWGQLTLWLSKYG